MHDSTDDRRPAIHAICVWCFRERQQAASFPVRLPLARAEGEETCCWCRRTTRAGIFVRNDPADVPCGGNPREPEQHA